MDPDSELARAKWLLAAGAMFLVSCFVCYSEMTYLFRGQQTQATVTQIYEVARRGRFGISHGTSLSVEYTFTEPDGTRRMDSDTVSSDWEVPPNRTVAVQYTPGPSGRSRLAGHVNWFGIGFFVVSLGVLGFFGYRLWREASQATKRGKATRRR
jgi:hypothetical protein